jgi:hypothetical protein
VKTLTITLLSSATDRSFAIRLIILALANFVNARG